MFDDKYVNLNSKKGVRDLVNLDFDFFYNDELVLDLPSKLIGDDVLYRKLTGKLQGKGFNVLFKGVTSNTYFGLPNNALRLLVVCSKSRSFLSFDELERIAIPHNFVAPLACLYGKKVSRLEKTYFNLVSKLGVPDDVASKELDDYLVFSEHGVNDNVFTLLGIKGNVDKEKFSDGSNKKPSNSKKLRDGISDDVRIKCLFPVNSVTGERYYHFDPNRTGCTVREIARLNGFPDSMDLSMYSGDVGGFIFRVNNSLSPFVVKSIFDVL